MSKFICPNFGTQHECRPERGWDEKAQRPTECSAPCFCSHTHVIADVDDKTLDREHSVGGYKRPVR